MYKCSRGVCWKINAVSTPWNLFFYFINSKVPAWLERPLYIRIYVGIEVVTPKNPTVSHINNTYENMSGQDLVHQQMSPDPTSHFGTIQHTTPPNPSICQVYNVWLRSSNAPLFALTNKEQDHISSMCLSSWHPSSISNCPLHSLSSL